MTQKGYAWCGVVLRRLPEPPAHDERAVYGFTAGALSVTLFVGRPTSQSLMQVRVKGAPDAMLYENVGHITFLLRESATAVHDVHSAIHALPHNQTSDAGVTSGKDRRPTTVVQTYQDSDVPHELYGQLGSYITSYRSNVGSIRVHLFRDQEVTAWVTKDSYTPMVEAQEFARSAVRDFETNRDGARVAYITYDPDCLGRR